MHAQRQRAVFFLIAKGVFHLVAVAPGQRAGVDIFHREIKSRFFDKVFHLAFFQGKLLFVGKGLVGAAAADAKMLTDAVL